MRNKIKLIEQINPLHNLKKSLCKNTIKYTLFSGNSYDGKIKISQNVKYLRIEFFCKKVKIPYSVTHLTLYHNGTNNIKIPYSVTHLTFNNDKYVKLKIPYSVTHLILNYYYIQKIKIPQYVTHLQINNYFYLKNIFLCQNINYLKISSLYKFKLRMPQNVLYIIFKNSQCKITEKREISLKTTKTILPINVIKITTRKYYRMNNIQHNMCQIMF